MKTLEDWIRSLVKQSPETLNHRYLDETVAREELDSMPLPLKNGHTVEASTVSGEALHQLHEKIRSQQFEGAIWDAVVWYLAHPLPMSIAHDLIDRGVSVCAMAMTRQVDEVQWRMATLFEDALYTLIRERYVKQEFSVEQFEVMLEMYTARRDGILYMLSYYETPSPEKKAVFLAAVESDREEGRNEVP